MPVANVNGINVAYNDTGTVNGDADGVMVLLHGSASAGSAWRGVQSHLAGKIRTITPEFYGCGRTEDWPGREQMSLAAEAALVSGLMARIPGPVHLVGHSYGGAVALRLATVNPLKVRSLTLVEPVAFHLLRTGGASDQRIFDEVADLIDVLCRAIISGDEWNAMGRFVDYWNGQGFWAALSWEQRTDLAPRIRTTVRHFWATIREAMPLQAYAALRMPTAIVSGARTRMPTARIAEILAGAIPNAQAIEISGGGHMLPLTHAEDLATSLLPVPQQSRARMTCAA